jgi:hypothetical protein
VYISVEETFDSLCKVILNLAILTVLVCCIILIAIFKPSIK